MQLCQDLTVVLECWSVFLKNEIELFHDSSIHTEGGKPRLNTGNKKNPNTHG